jgi:hypothetical protein
VEAGNQSDTTCFNSDFFVSFGKAIPNICLKNRFTREILKERILFYTTEVKQKKNSSHSIDEAVCKEDVPKKS